MVSTIERLHFIADMLNALALEIVAFANTVMKCNLGLLNTRCFE